MAQVSITAFWSDEPGSDNWIGYHPAHPSYLTAEEEFDQMLGGPAQRYKATLEKVDDLGIGDGIDKLLSP